MSIEVSIKIPEIVRFLRAQPSAPRSLTPKEAGVLQTYADRVLGYIQARWPVDTGTSVDAFEVSTRVNPSDIGITVENPMYYAEYVHNKGEDPHQGLWETLIPEAWQSVKSGCIAQMKTAIEATEKRIAERLRKGEDRKKTILSALRGDL